MIPKQKRYLLIGLFFAIISILSAVSLFMGNAEKKNFTYTIICALIAVLFLKNALVKQ